MPAINIMMQPEGLIFHGFKAVKNPSIPKNLGVLAMSSLPLPGTLLSKSRRKCQVGHMRSKQLPTNFRPMDRRGMLEVIDIARPCYPTLSSLKILHFRCSVADLPASPACVDTRSLQSSPLAALQRACYERPAYHPEASICRSAVVCL
jgi:hypothetical protein